MPAASPEHLHGPQREVNVDSIISGTIADGLLGRLAVATEQGGAWQRNRVSGESLGDKDKVAVRGQLQWDPAQALDFRLGVHWAQDKSDEQGLYLLAPYPVGGGARHNLADTLRWAPTDGPSVPTFAKLIGISANSKPGLDNSNLGADLTGNIDFGAAKLTSITAYNKLIRREYADWDATQFNDSDEYLNSGLNVFSQELRLAGNSGPFGWVAGVFYSNEDLHENFYSDLTNRLGGIAITTYEQVANSVGVFAQGNYQITDTLKATLGLREDHERRELIGLNTAFLPGAPSLTGGALGGSITSNLPSGKAELDYKPVSSTLLYASISRGVKSGGFTAHNTVTAPAADPFEPEKLTAYEIGMKSDLTRALRVDTSLFYYRYKDQQILGKVFDDASQSFIGRFVNANSRISGGEVDLEWRPLAGIVISQYAGFAEGYYTSKLLDVPLNPALPPVDYDGRPESFPKWSYGGDLSYSWNLGAFSVTLESNYSFHDTYSQFFLLGSNDFTIPKYWLANANLSLAPASGAPWTVTLWGRNIFDRSYDLTRNFFLPTSEVAAAGEPTTIGIRLAYKY